MFALRALIITLIAVLVVAFVWPDINSLLLILGPSLVVGLYLFLRPRKRAVRQADSKAGLDDLKARQSGKWVVIDGSNVMFWNDNKPSLETVKSAIALLERHGYSAGVVFDANVGYKISDRYIDDAELAAKLGLPADQTLVVPKGSVADTTVIKAARELGAKILTNDRYRDWAEEFPEVETPGHLIRGGYRKGALWLDLH